MNSQFCRNDNHGPGRVPGKADHAGGAVRSRWAGRQDRPGLATAPEREEALGVRVATDARLEPAEHKNSVYHPATPAMAEPARSGPIYKSEKFSDHAPVTIAYDRGF